MCKDFDCLVRSVGQDGDSILGHKDDVRITRKLASRDPGGDEAAVRVLVHNCHVAYNISLPCTMIPMKAYHGVFFC